MQTELNSTGILNEDELSVIAAFDNPNKSLLLEQSCHLFFSDGTHFRRLTMQVVVLFQIVWWSHFIATIAAGVYERLRRSGKMEIEIKDERLEKRWQFLVRSQMKVARDYLVNELQFEVNNAKATQRCPRIFHRSTSIFRM